MLNFSCKFDAHHPVQRYNHWEQKGVPVRLEVGPRDMESEQVVAVRRDTREKKNVPCDKLLAFTQSLLMDVQVRGDEMKHWKG